jgi:hypothetical protein
MRLLIDATAASVDVQVAGLDRLRKNVRVPKCIYYFLFASRFLSWLPFFFVCVFSSFCDEK